MSFAQEMAAFTPEAVQERITLRLRDGSGPAWNDSHGEPRWGLLLSAFFQWRENESQLQAVDACLNALVPELFAAKAWGAAEAASSYVLALGNLEQPWQPSQTDHWPFREWLRLPSATAADEQLQALSSALRLMSLRGLVQPSWGKTNFHSVADRAVGLGSSPWALYLLECWKAWARVARPNTGVVDHPIWFDFFRQMDRLYKHSVDARMLTPAMDWVLGRCRADERPAMVAELTTGIRHLPAGTPGPDLSAAYAGSIQAAAGLAARVVFGATTSLSMRGQIDGTARRGMAEVRSPTASTRRVSEPCLHAA